MIKKGPLSRFYYLLAILFLYCGQNFAQGDGPRSALITPKGLSGVSVKWLNMHQNFVPSGTIFTPDASVTVNAVPVAFFHSFALGKNIAQVLLAVVPGQTSGFIQSQNSPDPAIRFKASGFADGFIGLKYGLVNAPALAGKDFAAHKPRFTMQAYVRYWYSGTYKETAAINMGTNRQTIKLNFPMVLSLGNSGRYPYLLEMIPGLEVYSKNRPSNNSLPIIAQRPIYSIETFLTKNVNPKLWLSTGLRYYIGGETLTGETPEGNRMNVFAWGFGLGYQFTQPFGANITYGDVLWGYNKASVNMWRFSVTYTHLSKK
jgi:hypothetical protein